MDIRYLIAIEAAKIGGGLSRRFGLGGGTSLPGFIATRVDPDIVKKLSRHLQRSVIITGTNGKTTSSNMLADILVESGQMPVHNSEGANLVAGVVTSIINDLNSDRRGRIGLFEVDEATIPVVSKDIKPSVVAVTNIFRDQLDRYGELDHMAALIKKSLSHLRSGAKAVLNADDPRVATLSDGVDIDSLYFGIDDKSAAGDIVDEARDASNCVKCGAPLTYDHTYFAHLGKYRCSKCDFMRPKLDVRATNITLGIDQATFRVETPSDYFDVNLKISGLYNVYNALTAISSATALGIEVSTIKKALESFAPTFGRLETVIVDGKSVHLMLIKNPTGFNQVLKTLLLGEPSKEIVIAINDNIADGKDVSWLWDVEIESMSGSNNIITSGIRAEDMAVRLKYAGVEDARIRVESDMEKAIDEGLKRIEKGQTLYVLPTYTALLDIRKYLESIGDIEAFWNREVSV